MELTAGIIPGSAPSVPEFEEHGLDSLQFREEIQRLITAPPENASSFTALLELPPTKAVELLHHSLEADGSLTPANISGDALQTPYFQPLSSNLKFPTNPALIESAAKFSLFAGDYSSETSTVPSNSSANLVKVKYELVETDSNPNSISQPLGSDWTVEPKNGKSPAKRKEREKKAKGSSSKKSKSETSEDPDKLPYVHVRARRGQATDSHSLAERARREKINARMKYLQELVPGCNKISGTALVLDEIINHVQSLQREVEFLSMRVAAVKPKVGFNLDSIFVPENGSLMETNLPNIVTPMMWQDTSVSGNGQQYQQQWPIDVSHQPFMGREEHSSITPENSFLSYDSSANSVSLHSSQLKMEL